MCAASLLCVIALSGVGAQSSILLQSTNLRYDGAFRLPAGQSGVSTFELGAPGAAVTYNPANNSLFIVGHREHARTAEVTIPTPSKPSNIDSLTAATFRQGFTDALEGKKDQAVSGVDGTYISGMLVSGSSLITAVYGFYDAEMKQTNTHFKSGTNLSVTGDVLGPYRVGSTPAGRVSGYMTHLPAEWQTALGGTALTGMAGMSINSRTSLGPAASSFNAADVGTKSPVPATELVGYPLENPLPGWTKADEVRGVVVVPGTQSVLFFGKKGLGAECYGTGAECGDPVDEYKGYHSYPYAYYVWAYNLADLQAVKSGSKRPYDLRPYATWQLSLLFGSSNPSMRGAAFDPATNRIFLSTNVNSDGRAIIHVFTVTGVTRSTTAPSAPQNVRIVR
jgi:hypothetical protein